MARTSPSSAGGSKVEPLRKSMLMRVVAAGLLVLLAGRVYIASGGTKNPAGNDKSRPVIKTETRQLDPEKWCDWVTLPGGVDFQVDSPGWRQYQWPDGGKSPILNDKVSYLGTIRSSTFQIRGQAGVATITYEAPR